MTYLGIDPGDLTGVAVVSDSGGIMDFDNLNSDQMMEFLEKVKQYEPIHRIIMENYIVYRQRAQQHTGSKLVAAQVIGIVKFWAKQNNIPITLQMSHILSIAQKQSGLIPRGAHKVNHWVDAANHVYYYMYQKKLIPTPLERKLASEGN